MDSLVQEWKKFKGCERAHNKQNYYILLVWLFLKSEIIIVISSILKDGQEAFYLKNVIQ